MRAQIEAAKGRGGHGQAVTIVAVTKTHGPDAVQAAWDAGLRDVGENRVQEALPKMEAVSVPVRWHLIGHLQRNKVKSLDRFAMLQSLDSSRLADAVATHAEAEGKGRAVDALVQVNVVGELTKGGFPPSDWKQEAERLMSLRGIHVRGVMTMAPFDADERTLRKVFAGARAARDVLREAGHDATELSMGMSNDFEVAVEEGATIVRLGTILFGARSA
ncbi:MAG TPA: YggS family pyridoxal phosphate-dependent enzyme [Gemmatimonadaceae bacterium]|nr:YggS family pyridoxal phosphate-dependent enzyme [Gemmatimonadaceae bacterium]